MRSFQFENIWMLSHRDRRGLQIEFSEKSNLIQGRNHTGKSSLIKTLFLTLGARPQGNLNDWDAHTISLVGFRVNGTRYQALHQNGARALFDESGRLMLSTSEHAEWSKIFSEITGFNLVLSDKNGRSLPADPRCFFLPFYINQDGSWQSSWNTFAGIQQFTSPALPILEYFSGVKPPEYYESKANRDALGLRLEEHRRESVFLEKAQKRIGDKLKTSGPKIEQKNFQAEIESLSKEVTALNQRQEKLRDQYVKERELLSSLHMQIEAAKGALRVYEGDAKYLQSDNRDRLVCPTCNAEHEESFLDLLTYADDARSLQDITVRLGADALKVQNQLKNTLAEISQLSGQHVKISEILSVRKGEMEFRDVVESMGAEKAFQAFSEEAKALDKEISECLTEVEKHTQVMDRLTDRKRSLGIHSRFRESYSSALHNLNLPPLEGAKPRLTSRPALSGSGGPRSVLAYYAGLWSVCCGDTAAYLMPLVIDSPNQQGQDDINLPKVIEFVSKKLPQNTQVILGSEIDVNYQFDNQIILDRQYHLLREEFYATADQKLGPRVSMMYLKTRQ